MEVIENLKVKEKIYREKLENGLTVMIIPKHNTNKKYIIWGTHFGSIDNHFISPIENKETKIPDGVAHFLEHKLFEQENGTNSLDILSGLGVEANAYTTNDHTAYLYEATENFYEALDEFMNYVQNPYFTDENVEKEKGIIGQEIMMYDDEPSWRVYINAMNCMYQNNPIKIDIAGSVESISKINKEILYECYNTFYNLANMTLVVCGDFEPEKILEEIKNRITKTESIGEIKRIYEQETNDIVNKKIEVNMEVSNPIFIIGIKDEIQKENPVKRHIAVEILLNMLLGKSSNLYQELYEEGLLLAEPDLDYEFSKQYAHILISGTSKNPNQVLEKLKAEIKKLKEKGLDQDYFDRMKKMIYGQYIKEYNSVGNIARMFLADSFKGINSFEYLEDYASVTKEYTQKILQEIFQEEKMIISIVNPK